MDMPDIRTNAFMLRQQGLSMIEMMISITIGLLILAALSTLFVNQNKARSELDKSNRMIDNGRYALEILTDNLRMAGYYDSFLPSDIPTATPDPCSVATLTNAATNLDALLHHVQGYNAAAQASQISGPPCSLTYTAGSAATIKPGSDILVLRRASTATPVPAASAAAATIYLQASNCFTDSAFYQLAAGSAAFSALHEKDCTSLSGLRPFIVQVYFVSPDNNVGDGIPTLKRRELDQATGTFITTPLVEGIEYMQIDYGLDTNDDGSPDPPYIASPTMAQWVDIMSVRINIIARNNETTSGYTDTKSYVLGGAGVFGPFGDPYKRHAYTQLVRLVNPSSRREAP